MRHVIRLLQSLVTGNDSAIEYSIKEFFKAFHITNKNGLALLLPEDIPDGPTYSIWTIKSFKKILLS